MFQPSPELRALQLKCLEILDLVHAICRRHDIQYSLCGGSVVGAYLYGGFIPWDDDVDLMMTRENYNKFVQICQQELPPHYSLINYRTSRKYPSLFSKVMDNSTTLVQGENADERCIGGVFLDITCYDRIPTGWRRRVDMFFYTVSQWAFSARKSSCPRCYKDYMRNIWLALAGSHPSWLYKLSERVFTKLGYGQQYSYSELFGAYANTVAYPPSVFEHYTTIAFEGKEYMIVRDFIEYLQIRYNRTDFYEPEDKQHPPHYSYVDLEQPYEEYIKKLRSAHSDVPVVASRLSPSINNFGTEPKKDYKS